MTPLGRFTCEEAFRRIDDYVDRELGASEMELVRRHLEICEGCAREFHFEASVIDGVRRALRRIDLPDRFQERILAALGRDAAGG